MLQKILHRIFGHRHYWRTVGFSALAELYANRLLRLLAINLIGGFSGVYMYQLGYSLVQVLLVYTGYFLVKALFAIPGAYIIARIGPKHATLASGIIYIPGLIALTQVEGSGWAALALWATLVPIAVTLYDVSYHTGFSKAKTSLHAGKELGFMYVAERVGAGLSPLVGGVIAYLWDPTVTMWVACVLFIVSAAPLFVSPELVVTRQKITFRGFNWRKGWRSMVAVFGSGANTASTISSWPLFLALAIFGTTSNVAYAQIGSLATVGVIAALVFSQVYGALIDKRRGGELLRYAVIGNALLSLVRPFVSTPVGAALTNVANEAVAVGQAMPFLKGQYDLADDLPGYRIVYMSLMQVMVGLGSATFCLISAWLVYMSDDVRGLQLGYVVAALMSLLVLVHGFAALRLPRKRRR